MLRCWMPASDRAEKKKKMGKTGSTKIRTGKKLEREKIY
jgi:hypothetical protein